MLSIHLQHWVVIGQKSPNQSQTTNSALKFNYTGLNINLIILIERY